jgi:hypothetical protein
MMWHPGQHICMGVCFVDTTARLVVTHDADCADTSVAASQLVLPDSLRLRQRLRPLAAAATLALASQTPAMITIDQLLVATRSTASMCHKVGELL